MSVPKLILADQAETALGKSRADAVVIGTLATADGLALAPGAEAVDEQLDGQVLDTLRALGATGRAEEVVRVPTLGGLGADIVLAAGVGNCEADETPEAEQVRRAAGAAARDLAGFTRALNTLSSLDLAAAAEGSALGAYQFAEYKSQPPEKSPVSTIELVKPETGSTREHRATLKTAGATAAAVATARDLINTPPNDLFPAEFAERAKLLATEAGLEFEVLDEKALRRKGFGGILGVGAGSERPPRLLRLTHKPAKAKKKVALVGKGITFDSGGISIKPAANMDHMTSDMSGAAAMLANVVLAAKLNTPLEVTAHIPLAENLPSGTSYRPGDVLRMYSGKTVEVLNTDAEGRLVLADAIARAAEYSPDYLIETSTLTGAQTVALGNRTPGIMGSAEFRDRVAAHAIEAGEGGWAMPLPDELRSELDSQLADISNVTGQRFAGMLVAGVFLREFVAADLPWAHIDIAGPAFNTSSPWGYTGKGGTGVPVRTIANVLSDISING